MRITTKLNEELQTFANVSKISANITRKCPPSSVEMCGLERCMYQSCRSVQIHASKYKIDTFKKVYLLPIHFKITSRKFKFYLTILKKCL